MKEIFAALAGDIFVYGYSVPIISLIAASLLLLGTIRRSLPLIMVAGLIVLTWYFKSAIMGV